MSHDPSELEELRRRLDEAEQTIAALMGHEVDAVVTEIGAEPVLLRAAQAALRQSERRFTAVFDGASDPMVLFDGDDAVVDANAAACSLLGVARDRVAEQPGLEALDALASADEPEGVAELCTADGRQLTVEFSTATVQPGLRLSIFRDITRARATQAAQARLAAIVESSEDAFVCLSCDGVIVDWNAAAERLYGYTAAEALGKTPSFLEAPTRQGEWQQTWQAVLDSNAASELTTTRRRKDGSLVDVSVILSPIRDSSHEVIGWSKSVRDLTELKRADERFRAVLNAAPDPIVASDREGRIVVVNGRAEEVFGYERGELLGAPIQLLVPEDSRRRHAEYEQQYVQAPEPRTMSGGREVKARRKDGSIFDAEITLSPIQGSDGLLIIAAVRDVTERNNMREQLMLSDRMVSVGTLAAGLAHEINNPLAAVTANLELALEDLAPLLPRTEGVAEIQEELQDARDAAERVRQIVRDLKIFSRSDHEQLHAVDVRRVMESTLRMAWNEIRHRARLVKDYAPVPPVHASESRLGQVFLNIVVNAAQAIPLGNADANVIRVTTELEGDEVVVCISDTGPGMPPEILKHLFTPFFTTKPVGEGTGLGLSISHRLVTGFGGRISVESRVDHGTAFRIHLRPASVDEPVAFVGAPATDTGRRGHVLVIDDEEGLLHAVRRSLSSRHEVVALTSAREALERILAGERFDVILCDLMMPQMTGMELHDTLVASVPEQAERMVFVTGGAFTPSARAFLDRVANLRLEKPFDLPQLRALLNEKIR